jgi:hypothetical protein
MIKLCKLKNTTLVKNQSITKSCYKYNFLIINPIFLLILLLNLQIFFFVNKKETKLPRSLKKKHLSKYCNHNRHMFCHMCGNQNRWDCAWTLLCIGGTFHRNKTCLRTIKTCLLFFHVHGNQNR